MNELKKLLENAGLSMREAGGQFGDQYDDWDEIMQAHLASLQHIASTELSDLVMQALRNTGWEGELESLPRLTGVEYNNDGSVTLNIELPEEDYEEGGGDQSVMVTVLGSKVKGNW
jgi:hypothetical protein